MVGAELGIQSGQLTDREWAVASRVGRGERTKAVAAALHLSPRTVETHLASVYRKLGVGSRTELAGLLAEQQVMGVESPGSAPMPPIRYATCHGRSIAYQTFGQGPADIVMVPGLASHLEMLWEQPSWRRFTARMSKVGRLIVFDKRGTGLSDPIDRAESLSHDLRMADTLAVLDAAGSERAVMFGLSEGGQMSLYAAVAHPERIGAVCVYGSVVLPSLDGLEIRRRLVGLVERSFGQGDIGAILWPSLDRLPGGRAWLARYERHVSSPGMLIQLMSTVIDVDMSGIIDSVRVPVTIVHNVDDPAVPYREAERLARAMPSAKLVPIAGVDHMPWGEVDTQKLLDEIADLTRRMQEDPAVATVLRALVGVMDVGPDHMARLEGWVASCGGASRHHAGRVVGLFDSVDRARRCASTLAAMFPTLRIAVHSGEVTETTYGLKGRAVDDLLHLGASASPGKPEFSPVAQALSTR